MVTIDGKKGLVFEGKLKDESSETTETAAAAAPTVVQPSFLTVTEVKVNVSMVR